MYGAALANVDWLHGSAEFLLTLTNLFIVLGMRGERGCLGGVVRKQSAGGCCCERQGACGEGACTATHLATPARPLLMPAGVTATNRPAGAIRKAEAENAAKTAAAAAAGGAAAEERQPAARRED